MAFELDLPEWAGGEENFKQDLNTGILTSTLDLSDFVGDYGYIQTYDDLDRFLDKMASAGTTVSYDIETGYSGMDAPKRALDIYNPDQMIVGISMTNDINMARYVPLKHDAESGNLDPNKVWPRIKEFFEAGVVDLEAHNHAFEARNLRTLDMKGDGPNIYPARMHDTMIQSFVIGQSREHGLKALSSHWFNYDQRELTDLVASYAPKDKNGNPKLTADAKAALRFNRLPLDFSVMKYVCDDVTWCLRLSQLFRPNLNQFGEGDLDRMYQMELDIMNLLVEMSEYGITVDWDGISEGLSNYHVIIANMEKEARRILAELVDAEFAAQFNFGSPQQVSNLLFSILGLTPSSFTPKGAPSTSEGTLESIRRDHPIVDLILKLRQAKKMGQWFEQWVGYRTTHDDKVHPGLNQIKVQSGRFASDNPNVQNITKRWWYSAVPRDWSRFPASNDGEAAYEEYVEATSIPNDEFWTGNARRFLTASPGYRLLSFDYAAQEMRVLAGLSREPYLMKSFEDGVDVHKTAASLMFHVPVDEVTKDQRQRGKGINFGLIYGRGPKALAADFGISVDEAQELTDLYFAAFTKVGSWIDSQKAEGKGKYQVTSFYGRRSTLWDLMDEKNKMLMSKGERMCVNIPVQGGGADISKLAMLRSRKALIDRGWWGTQVRMLMNQHDSLVFEVRDDVNLNDVVALLEPEVMLKGVPEMAQFPKMEVDWEFGHRWGDVTAYTPDDAQMEDREVHSEVSEVSEVSFSENLTQNITAGGKMQVRFSKDEFSVEFGDEEGRKQFPQHWDSWNVVQQFTKLSALTELVGLNYLKDHGVIPVEVFKDGARRLSIVLKQDD